MKIFDNGNWVTKVEEDVKDQFMTQIDSSILTSIDENF